MRPFFKGFVDELIKVAQPNMFAPLPTAGGASRPPAPANFSGPSGSMLGSMRQQKMESPAGDQQPSWRPSPGYRPNPMSDPKPASTPKPAGGGGRGRGADSGPAWETAPQQVQRQNRESAYNKALKSGGVPGASPNIKPLQPGGYQLKPGQAPTPAPKSAPTTQPKPGNTTPVHLK